MRLRRLDLSNMNTIVYTRDDIRSILSIGSLNNQFLEASNHQHQMLSLGAGVALLPQLLLGYCF